MKKAIIIPILLLFSVIITSCSKDKDEPENTDKSAAVSQTYQGKLTLGTSPNTVEYQNVKIKITRKGTNEVAIEPVSGESYPAFAAITFSSFLFSSATNMYASSNPGPMIFTFQSNGTINMQLAYNFNNTVVFFEGPNVK
ncbi:hypothetical protein [Pedobacter nyackensis]|uniref:Lipoprotein n=1 Tax=Pedobacter nyackensis TaxID=475255 RepID=A0A1W2BKS6_9SPHI|nr:hypothetical protein [Pedobacter nyackensis]SMC73252.1 hypothetical protein SAMN04488101_102551 [Pedobacter nyackensis]